MADVILVDTWVDPESIKAYCIYIDRDIKETDKKSNLFLAEGKYYGDLPN